MHVLDLQFVKDHTDTEPCFLFCLGMKDCVGFEVPAPGLGFISLFPPCFPMITSLFSCIAINLDSSAA